MTRRAPVTPAELEAALLRLAGQAASQARRTSSYSRRVRKEAAASAYRRGADMVRKAQSKRPPATSAESVLSELRKAREAFPVLRVEDATNLAALDVHADLRDEAMEALLGVVDRLLARKEGAS